MTMKFISKLVFLIILSSDVRANLKAKAYAELPIESYQRINNQLSNKTSDGFGLKLNKHKQLDFTILQKYSHANGDASFQAKTHDGTGYLDVTIGNDSIFGQLHHDDKHYILSTDVNGSWLIELPKTGVVYNSCDHENHKTPLVNFPAKKAESSNQINSSNSTVIDVMFVYNQALADRYPGELMATRMNQYLNLANQSFANTELPVILRIVSVEHIPYELNNSNNDALDGIRTSLAGGVVAGLETLKQRRETLGADLVVMIRPHDMNTRGGCGLAFLPVVTNSVFDKTYGAHMISDGMSSWSLCTDQVFIHEVGHNLGTGHHNVAVENRFIPDAAGFAKIGQFNTIMGSFGTGRPDRFFELPLFSNPSVQCGGVPCGVFGSANNANVIQQMMGFVAAYQAPFSSAPIPEALSRAEPDSDGDGSTDWDDAFPFDPTETIDSDNDAIGDNSDVFPNNNAEQVDFDLDGTGNNQDTDDDNDGISDFADDFPLDPMESNDQDNDGVGDNADDFPADITEKLDFDLDGIGDNSDVDDDNDGAIDLSSQQQDILVVSTGNNRLLRFNAQTGESHGIEILPEDGLLTFQSDLAYRAEDQVLFYTSSSSVKRLDLMNREPLGVFVPAYSTDSVQLGSGFPTSLSSINSGGSIVATTVRNTRAIAIDGKESATNYSNIVWDFMEGDNILDSVNNGSETYFLGQLTKLYKTTNADPVTQLGNIIHSWMGSPYAMALSNDNRLFVSNQDSNIIGMVNVVTGLYLGVFANLSDYAYSNPTGIAITQEDVLLVAASDQNAIVKFDLNTGDFLGELVSGNGIDKPHKMILVPQLNDRFNHDPDKVIRPNAGLWYNRDSSGRGFDIEIFNNRLAVIWYTFDQSGLPIWYISSGDLNGFQYQSDFVRTHLNPDNTVTMEAVGTVSIEFTSERTAQINWQLNTATGSETLVWLSFSLDPENANYTGLWGRPDGPGWGVSVSTIGPTSIAVPYIYDTNGDPRWLISDPVNGLSPLVFQLKAVFSNTLCPSCSGESVFETMAAGTTTLNLSGENSWDSQILLPTPLDGDWTLENTELRLFSNEATRPR